MMLGLRRIGWEVKNVTEWVEDRGIEHSLLYTSPSLIKHLMCQAVQRPHERTMASLVGVPAHENGSQARVCVDIVRTMACRSKKLSARQNYAITSCFTKAAFTNDRLRALGYESDGLCPLCGQQDSLHHRLWCCRAQERVEAREAAASLEIIAEGAQAG
eukprot:266892-Pyramimonas_sp.AAC.1